MQTKTVDQFMDRATGLAMLRRASQVLAVASTALRERADDRENLSGPTNMLIGGLGQAVESLADQLEDGVKGEQG